MGCKTDIFEISSEEFDKWLATANSKDITATSRIVLKKLSDKNISQEELRRANAFYAKVKDLCCGYNVINWIIYKFPTILIYLFQVYLIFGKIYQFGPFHNLPWSIIVFPVLFDQISKILFSCPKSK